MTRLLLIAILATLVLPAQAGEAQGATSASDSRTPVLVELFTSEGCSSCPPADRFLPELDPMQPVSGAEIIVLSEHVDYWNHDGWVDPFSSHSLTDRQSQYASHFGLDTVYTPQMVVDGKAQFVGNSPKTAKPLLQEAAAVSKVPIHITSVSLDSNAVRAHLQVDALPSPKKSRADVYIAIALNQAESQVTRGENEGHKLTHVAAVRTLLKVGTVSDSKAFDQDVQVKLQSPQDAGNLRLVAFVQESGPARVLGASVVRLGSDAQASW